MSKLPENEQEALEINPRPVDVTYGIREPKNLKIWPMAVGEQMELSDTISKAVASFLEQQGEDAEMADVVGFVIDLIRKNVVKIFKIVADKPEETDFELVLKDMTNDQLVFICIKIYEMNYQAAAKNLKSLFGNLSPMFLSERPAPVSSPAQDIDLKTSSESDTETEG